MLPVAPATDCIASTSGTPAANMVDSVREKRAIAALTMIGPMTGNFSSMRSRKRRMFLERFLKYMNAQTPAPTRISSNQP